MSEDAHREYLLAALRVASLRSKAWQMEIDNIGMALKDKMMSPEQVVRWLIANDSLSCLGIVPEDIANPGMKVK